MGEGPPGRGREKEGNGGVGRNGKGYPPEKKSWLWPCFFTETVED